MSKIVVVLIAVAVIGLAGAGAYITLSKQTSQTSEETADQQMVANEDNRGTPSSLAELMALSSNQQCTFVDAESNSSGTVYVGNGQIKGDFTTESEGETMNGHMITRDDGIYIWFDGQDQGLKVSVSDLSEMDYEDYNTEILDPEQDVDYECKGWNVDNSMFDLPEGVEFVDFSAMMMELQESMENLDMDSMMEGETSDLSSQCAACNSLPEEAQAQCLSALGCE